MLKIGDKLLCSYGTEFPDYTTKDKIYEVVDVFFHQSSCNHTFKIINDKGEISLPLLSTFKKIK